MKIHVDYIDGTQDDEEITSDHNTEWQYFKESQTYGFVSSTDRVVLKYPVAFVKKIRIDY